MKQKKISKVGARWNDLLSESKKQMEKIEKPKREKKKKFVKDENNFDVGDIGVDIDKSFDVDEDFENLTSEV